MELEPAGARETGAHGPVVVRVRTPYSGKGKKPAAAEGRGVPGCDMPKSGTARVDHAERFVWAAPSAILIWASLHRIVGFLRGLFARPGRIAVL